MAETETITKNEATVAINTTADASTLALNRALTSIV